MQVTNNNSLIEYTHSQSYCLAKQTDKYFVQYTNVSQVATSINDRKLELVVTTVHWHIDTENKSLTSSTNSKEFIEVTRRIKKNKQAYINEQLSLINSKDLTELQQLYFQPELLLTTKNAFFTDKKFPFVILKALQLKFISVVEFASLQTWHEVFQEQKKLNPEAKPQIYNLLNVDNSYNKVAWDIIASSIESYGESVNTKIIQINTSQIIADLKLKAVNSSPINCCFLLFDLAKPISKNSLYKKLMNSGVKFFSVYQNKKISINFSLCQNFLDATFINNSCNINPVIGLSSVEDIRNSGYKLWRDLAIPFPEHELPTEIHGYSAEEILEFQYHDIYHAFHMCLMTPKDIKFYLKIGDAVLELRNNCDATINALQQLIFGKLKHIDAFKHKLTNMQPHNRITAEKILFSEFYCITKILQLLKNTRKAYGQFKFEMYDTDVNHFANREQNLLAKYDENGVHLLNIILLLARKNEKQPVLSGYPVQLAGKTVIKATNSMLNMDSAWRHFTKLFKKQIYESHNLNILNFLIGGLKYLESIRQDDTNSNFNS